MREVSWTPFAFTRYATYLGDLTDSRPLSAGHLQTTMEVVLDRVARRPEIGRPSQRWPGYREWSFVRWRKLLVYRASPERLTIYQFLDARQDLAAVDIADE